MTGIFDSGVGGLSAYREFRRLMPSEDVIYLADKRNAPYGTKKKEELIRLVENDIQRLLTLGAERILIACCTASTVHGELCEELREISLPIIVPSARAATSHGDRIAVIATEGTVQSHAFLKEIRNISKGAQVFEFPEQRLVSLIESGSRDGDLTDECRRELLKIRDRVSDVGADTLILGCTHFSHVEGELLRLMPKIRTVCAAKSGARELARLIRTKNIMPECGRVTYTI